MGDTPGAVQPGRLLIQPGRLLITLIGSDLRSIVTAIALSRKTVSVIKLGLFWAFAYKVVLIVANQDARAGQSLKAGR
jgi:hypothetical protein